MQGLFWFEGETFQIQPLYKENPTINDLHVVTKVKHIPQTDFKCHQESVNLPSLLGKQADRKSNLWRQRRALNIANTLYIELVIVNDLQQVEKFNGSLRALEQNIFQVK